MEIYNEAVRDLLSTDLTPLRLLDDPEVRLIYLIMNARNELSSLYIFREKQVLKFIFIFIFEIPIERDYCGEAHRRNITGPRSFERVAFRV
jgi:hypothetical protein